MVEFFDLHAIEKHPQHPLTQTAIMVREKR
jgi:hypothetical protein